MVRRVRETHRSIQGPIWLLAQEPGCLDSQDLNNSWLQGFQLQETFGTLVSSAPHCPILPDLQVGFCLLGIICVEVPLPDLAPELQERTGVRDGVCLAGSQQKPSQHRNP